MNPSTALARVLVDELVRQGVREAVLCPGSRSAPLAYALQDADRAGRLRLHVRVDERSAGFLAVGLAKLTRTPAVVVTTSGTAVANLHPAVLEAHHGVVPLLVFTADRPPELRGTGANQTTVQPGMFGPALRWSHELGTPEHRGGQQSGWRSVVSRAVSAARGYRGDAGPVHVNVPLREPLVPDEDADWPEDLGGRADGSGWTVAPPVGHDGPPASTVTPVPRTLVVVGDLPSPGQFEQAVRWAASQGWPVVAEPFGVHPRREVIPHGPLLLTATGWVDAHAPDQVVTVGRVTLSRAVAQLLRRPGVRLETVTATATWTDPSGLAAAAHGFDAVRVDGAPGGRGADAPGDPAWRDAWRQAGERLGAALRADPVPWPSGPAVATEVLAALPDGSTLFVGSSNAARDVDLAVGGPVAGVTVVASRGLAGIDGCVSTAVGLALSGSGPAYALMGDLTFLHDSNGLLIGPDEPAPDLTIVVGNDDGGGIFTLLEPGEPARSAQFERVFGTPTRTDLAALCAAHGVAHEVTATREALHAAVRALPSGLRVVEVPLERDAHRDVHAQLRAVAASALES